jgi:hypothetical protein
MYVILKEKGEMYNIKELEDKLYQHQIRELV